MPQQKVVASKRIAVGGMQHETNTFAPHLATLDAFERADSWPALTVGEPFSTPCGAQYSVVRLYRTRRGDGHHLHPLCWCSAEPSSYVTREAFERVAE